MSFINDGFGNFVNNANIRFGFFQKKYACIGTDIAAVKINFNFFTEIS
jgi:hypothetical protein